MPTPFTMMGTDTDANPEDLIQTIQRISQAPLVPSNPLLQLGVALQGMQSGLTGKESPLVGALRQQRETQLEGLKTSGTLGIALEQHRLAKKKAILDLAGEMTKSPIPDVQEKGYLSIETETGALGMTPEQIKTMVNDPALGFPKDDVGVLARSLFKEAIGKGKPISPSQAITKASQNLQTSTVISLARDAVEGETPEIRRKAAAALVLSKKAVDQTFIQLIYDSQANPDPKIRAKAEAAIQRLEKFRTDTKSSNIFDLLMKGEGTGTTAAPNEFDYDPATGMLKPRANR